MKIKVNVIDNKVKVVDFLSLRSVDLDGLLTNMLLYESGEKADALENYEHSKVWTIVDGKVCPSVIVSDDVRNFILYVDKFGYVAMEDGDLIFSDAAEAEAYLQENEDRA